jgi:hypothetical protein
MTAAEKKKAKKAKKKQQKKQESVSSIALEADKSGWFSGRLFLNHWLGSGLSLLGSFHWC